MIFDAFVWLATSIVAIAGTGGLGIAGIVIGLLKDKSEWFARFGTALIGLALFLSGYHVADRAADEKARIGALQGQVVSLTHQLASQKLVGLIASGEREQLRKDKDAARYEADTYKAMLASVEKKAPTDAKSKASHDPCALNRADLQFRDRVRRHARPAP